MDFIEPVGLIFMQALRFRAWVLERRIVRGLKKNFILLMAFYIIDKKQFKYAYYVPKSWQSIAKGLHFCS